MATLVAIPLASAGGKTPPGSLRCKLSGGRGTLQPTKLQTGYMR
jgi:hypothetical protein